MEFKVFHATTKHLEHPYHTIKPTPENPAPRNKLVWCISKFGCGRVDIFNPNFDIEFALLPVTSKNAKQ